MINSKLTHPDATGYPWGTLLLLAMFWLTAAALMPVVQDEAYYFSWAQHLEGGYFDHPPLVALISLSSRWAHGRILIARLGTVLVALATALASVRLWRLLGWRQRSAQATGLLLTFGNILGLSFGVITTPDTGLMLAWVLALGEAAAAQQGQPKRWLTAGLATGLGLWSKYMMVLIGPVFLWLLIADARRPVAGKKPQLLTPWPYLGGILALLVFSPHLAWNARHDWITWRFQMAHGLGLEHFNTAEGLHLPWPKAAVKGSPEWEVAQPFRALEEVEAATEHRAHPYDALFKSLNRYLGYYLGQIGAFGAVAIVLGRSLWQRRRAASAWTRRSLTHLSRGDVLAVAAAAVPLLVFGLFSLKARVEINWSAMYLFGAAALATPLVLPQLRALRWAVLVNIALLAAAVAQAATGFLPTRPQRDRMLAETHGYQDLAVFLTHLSGPLFADSYQIVAMTRFYQPGLQVTQWPGITRDSEFVLRPDGFAQNREALAQTGFFWLVTGSMPQQLDGFVATAMTLLRDCKDAELQVISSVAARAMAPTCAKPIHEWYLVRYETLPSHK